MEYQLIGEADAVELIERGSTRRVDLECFTLHQLRDGRLLVDFLSGDCAILRRRDNLAKTTHVAPSGGHRPTRAATRQAPTRASRRIALP